MTFINQFDIKNYPEVEPESATLYSLWTWKRTELSKTYDPALYDLIYTFINRDEKGSSFAITAANVDGVFVVEWESPNNSEHGYYHFDAKIVRKSDGKSTVVFSDFIDVLSPLASGHSSSHPTHAYKTLIAIRATIEKSATKEQQAYSIAGRSLSRRSFEELVMLEKVYARKVSLERRASRIKAGKSVKSSNTLVRLGV